MSSGQSALLQTVNNYYLPMENAQYRREPLESKVSVYTSDCSSLSVQAYSPLFSPLYFSYYSNIVDY